MVHKVSERKRNYRERFVQYLSNHKTIIVVTANHVGSFQLQQIRQELRGRALVLMGKNTMVRMIVREFIQVDPAVEKFLPCIKGNCGFVFTNEDVKEIRDILLKNRVQSIARPGVIAPNDVIVPAGPTGLDPGQTSFFQALNIGTKIVKGQVEITSKVYLISKGDKVGNSECALLNKLDIKPFNYGLIVASVFTEGDAFSPEVLDMTESDLISKFMAAARVTAALGLHIGIPNTSAVPFSFKNAFRKLLAISVQSEYIIEAAIPYKKYLDNPEEFSAALASAAPAPVAADNGAAGDDQKPADEEDESSEADAGVGGMFGSDSDSE